MVSDLLACLEVVLALLYYTLAQPDGLSWFKYMTVLPYYSLPGSTPTPRKYFRVCVPPSAGAGGGSDVCSDL